MINFGEGMNTVAFVETNFAFSKTGCNDAKAEC